MKPARDLYKSLSEPWQHCIDLAWEAYCAGSLPIAAVMTDESGTIVATGRNRIGDKKIVHPYISNHALAHAELNALLVLNEAEVNRKACTLYTTTEPCPLCMGAIRMAGVRRFHYACRDPWAGCAMMTEVVPYVAAKVQGTPPQSEALEACLAALLVEACLQTAPKHPAFFESWRNVLPVGSEVGTRLFETGKLRTLAQEGTSAREMLSVVSRLVSTSS